MKKIDSQALGIANKALGLTGAGSPLTELTDGVVDQVLDVGQIVRRSRTLGISEGIFTAIMLNEHTGAQTLTTSVNPFELGALARPPFPSPIPASLDLWLIGAVLSRTSGTNTMSAGIFLEFPPTMLAYGVDDGGGAVTDTPLFQVIYWDTIVVTGTTFGRLVNTGIGANAFIGVRLSRNLVSLRFVSATLATSDLQAFLMFGLFPVGLGQDVIV